MKNLIFKLYKENRVIYLLLSPVKWIADLIRYNRFTDRKFIQQHFYRKMGYKIDLTSPKTFNEKLQWIKLYENNDLKILCTDKYAVREHIKAIIGEQYLISLIFHTTDPKKITKDVIPDYPVIVKTNHSSGNVFIIKNKKETNFALIQKELRDQLQFNFYHSLRERHYKQIEPRIIIESLLLNEQEEIPEDYKIHCFNGKPMFIQVDCGRFKDHKRIIYDTKWQKIDLQFNFPMSNEVSPPQSLSEMLYLAEKLAEPFNYVRVDLYENNSFVYFGELTFTPEAGFGYFNPPEMDSVWGDLLTL